MIILNGKESKTYESLTELLNANEFRKERIAVEINGEIIKRDNYDTTKINDGDVIEVVHFMGGGSGAAEDKLILGGHEFNSRFILGSGKYSLDLIKAAIECAGAEIITLALRRAAGGEVANILDYIPDNVTLLPNTSGARNADEAVRIARLARETCCGDFVKI